MPFASRRQQRWAHATGQSFAKRWDKVTDFDALPEKKDSASTGMAIPPTGNNALFNSPGIGTLANRRKKIKLKACDCGCNAVEKAFSDTAAPGAKPKPAGKPPAGPGASAKPAGKGEPGELLEPGVRRIRGNLCNVHGRYGPCDGAAGKPKKPKKGRAGGAGAKPKKPPKTDEQRQAERDAKKLEREAALTAEQAKNLTKVGDETELGDHLANLNQFAQGKPLRPEDIDFLAKEGLLEIGSDGVPRKSEQANVLLNAAKRGDVQGARDAASRARDQVAKRSAAEVERTAREAKKLAAQAEREAAQAEREAERAKKPGGGEKKPDKAPGKLAARRAGRSGAGGGGGGGAGGSFSATPGKQTEAAPKPTKEEEQQANRAAVRDTMAQTDQGLSPNGFDILMDLGAGTEPDARGAVGLIVMGLAEMGSDNVLRLSSAGRQAIAAANRGDAKAAIDVISRASEPPKKKKEARSYLLRRKEQITIKHGAHDQSSHGRKRGGGGGGVASIRGVTSKVLPEGHPILQRFGHNTENYREFDDPMRADAAMTSMYQGWANSLTDEEKNAVRGYQQQTFGLVNDTLRGHRSDDDKTPFARQETQKLDTALNSADVPYNVTTYRGMVNPGLSVGAEFTDLGYGSTTLAPAIARARAQAHGDQGVVARIKVPQGAKGAYVETVTPIDQAELLLHRGTRYRVIGTGNGVIDLEVVN